MASCIKYITYQFQELDKVLSNFGKIIASLKTHQQNWCVHMILSLIVCKLQQHYAPMPTTLGALEPPLGNSRLQMVRLLASVLLTNTPSVLTEIANLGTLNVLFVSYLIINLVMSFLIISCSVILLSLMMFTFFTSGSVFQVYLEQLPSHTSWVMCHYHPQQPTRRSWWGREEFTSSSFTGI